MKSADEKIDALEANGDEEAVDEVGIDADVSEAAEADAEEVQRDGPINLPQFRESVLQAVERAQESGLEADDVAAELRDIEQSMDVIYEMNQRHAARMRQMQNPE